MQGTVRALPEMPRWVFADLESLTMMVVYHRTFAALLYCLFAFWIWRGHTNRMSAAARSLEAGSLGSQVSEGPQDCSYSRSKWRSGQLAALGHLSRAPTDMRL